MLVQYLVGLFCLRHDPKAVDITIGDMVFDLAAGKERDVDVTVTAADAPNSTIAVKAYEVKREGEPLDVGKVEGLCLKLADMPRITQKAIVSNSGFTEGAVAKAARHGVDLYTLEHWTSQLESDFPDFGLTGVPENTLHFIRSLLTWNDCTVRPLVPSGPSSFTIEHMEPILTSTGKPHKRFATFNDYSSDLLLRSTELLYDLEPARTVFRTFPADWTSWDSYGPAWPHTHTMDTSSDRAFLRLSGEVLRVESATINGFLQWQHKRERPSFVLMRRVTDGEPFAGALVALGQREGQMFAFTIANSTRAGVHLVQLEEKHLNAIRRLKLDVALEPVPPSDGESL